MAHIRVVTTRAPGLIPSLIKEIDHASNPVVLVPESFTLACETEIVNRSRDAGIFNLNIFSPSSLIREVRELTGHGDKKPISGDGQNMIISQVLLIPELIKMSEGIKIKNIKFNIKKVLVAHLAFLLLTCFPVLMFSRLCFKYIYVPGRKI